LQSGAEGDLPAMLAMLTRTSPGSTRRDFPVSEAITWAGHVKAVLIRVATEWEGLKVTPEEFLVKSPFVHAWGLRDRRVVEWRAY
jgi:hypothetical protein